MLTCSSPLRSCSSWLTRLTRTCSPWRRAVTCKQLTARHQLTNTSAPPECMTSLAELTNTAHGLMMRAVRHQERTNTTAPCTAPELVNTVRHQHALRKHPSASPACVPDLVPPPGPALPDCLGSAGSRRFGSRRFGSRRFGFGLRSFPGPAGTPEGCLLLAFFTLRRIRGAPPKGVYPGPRGRHREPCQRALEGTDDARRWSERHHADDARRWSERNHPALFAGANGTMRFGSVVATMSSANATPRIAPFNGLIKTLRGLKRPHVPVPNSISPS